MKFNNETIREEVKEWCNDEESALKKYGHIKDWDTSRNYLQCACLCNQ